MSRVSLIIRKFFFKKFRKGNFRLTKEFLTFCIQFYFLTVFPTSYGAFCKVTSECSTEIKENAPISFDWLIFKSFRIRLVDSSDDFIKGV